MFFFFKQKTAYEMRISDWSSDVCSSDLAGAEAAALHPVARAAEVEVDLVVAARGTFARAGGEVFRLSAAELQRHRVLAGVEGQQAVAVAVQDGARRHHLGVDHRALADDSQGGPLVPVVPVLPPRYREPILCLCQVVIVSNP